MEQGYFENSPIQGDLRIEAYSKLISEEVNTSIMNKYDITLINKNAKPLKPIIVKDITEITEFTSNLEKNCDPNFLVVVAGKLINPKSL